MTLSLYDVRVFIERRGLPPFLCGCNGSTTSEMGPAFLNTQLRFAFPRTGCLSPVRNNAAAVA